MKYMYGIEKWGLCLAILIACFQPVSAQSHLRTPVIVIHTSSHGFQGE